MGKRQERVDEVRRRVLDAARALLREGGSYTSFTVDAVAKRADVARATVYYQFGSKTGLLEAVCDDIAEVGAMSGLAGAFTQPDLERALREFIEVFGRFWAADRQVMRRLRALAALDPDVETVIAARDTRRLQAVTALLGRFDGADGSVETNARVLYTLTSFETYDMLAGPDGDVADAAALVRNLAVAALGLATGGAAELVAERRCARSRPSGRPVQSRTSRRAARCREL
jgi:AcrR family transcriptional regulator